MTGEVRAHRVRAAVAQESVLQPTVRRGGLLHLWVLILGGSSFSRTAAGHRLCALVDNSVFAISGAQDMLTVCAALPRLLTRRVISPSPYKVVNM